VHHLHLRRSHLWLSSWNGRCGGLGWASNIGGGSSERSMASNLAGGSSKEADRWRTRTELGIIHDMQRHQRVLNLEVSTNMQGLWRVGESTSFPKIFSSICSSWSIRSKRCLDGCQDDRQLPEVIPICRPCGGYGPLHTSRREMGLSHFWFLFRFLFLPAFSVFYCFFILFLYFIFSL
jgi:hypothetical protein